MEFGDTGGAEQPMDHIVVEFPIRYFPGELNKENPAGVK